MGWLRVGEVESLSDFLYCMWALFREHLVGGQCALLQKNWHSSRGCAAGLEKGHAHRCAPLRLQHLGRAPCASQAAAAAAPHRIRRASNAP